jgi:hypothetical protein
MRWGWVGRAVGIVLVSSLASAATPAETSEAKRAFEAGVNLLQDPDGARYDEAIVHFRKAYSLIGSWKVLGNLGLCALKLERDGEAIDAYEKYLAEGKTEIDPGERTQVERDLRTLKAQVVKVRFQFGAAASRVVDERPNARGAMVRNEYPVAAATLELGLHPGHHVIVAQLAQGDTRWEADLAPGSTVSHVFEAPSGAASPARPSEKTSVSASATSDGSGKKTAAYAAGAVGIVGVGVGTFFGLRAISKRGEAEDHCSQGRCSAEAYSLNDDAKGAANVSNVAIGLGVVAIGVGAFLLLTAPSSSSSAGARTRRLVVAPDARPGHAGVAIGGRW